MAGKTLPASLENIKDGKREFDGLFNKLNLLAHVFDTKGPMDESPMTLDWSERRGVAAMLRELTDDLESLWGHCAMARDLVDAVTK